LVNVHFSSLKALQKSSPFHVYELAPDKVKFPQMQVSTLHKIKQGIDQQIF